MNEQAGLSFTFYLLIFSCLRLSLVQADEIDIDYSRDIVPIFAKHCYQCHGSDKTTRQANLRLDELTPMVQASEPKVLIRPGSLEASHLWQRITAKDERRMPPPNHAEALTPTQQSLIRDWILT
ncbi:MAG: c-type cytochrome domain-containing protein, partial [Planctomycetota bacterium]|nr:c-type cytochrome domain-containing protein [Planctomycetota bacterium]